MALLQLKKSCTLAREGEPLRCGTLQAANASARAVLRHPHPARYVGALSLCAVRPHDSRRGQLAARSQEPARTRRISETHPTRCVSGPRKFNIWATEHPAPRRFVLADVPQATSETLVGRNFLNTNRSFQNRGPASPTPWPSSILCGPVERGGAAASPYAGVTPKDADRLP